MRYLFATLLFLVLSLNLSSGLAQSGNLPSHVPEPVVQQIRARFHQVLQEGGSAKVARDIQVCYDIAFMAKPNREPLSRCLLYDAGATSLDRTMVNISVARGLPRLDGSNLFFSRDASTTRLNLYSTLVFGDERNALVYFGDAIKRVQDPVNE
jgi:hypothetical protein